MRWLHINCVLIAGFAILSATYAEGPRDKRDFTLIKKLIKSAIFGSENRPAPAPILINNEENVRIFRVPGFDDILIKAIPKMPVAIADPGIIKVMPVSVAIDGVKVKRPQILLDSSTICDGKVTGMSPINNRPVVIQEPTFWQDQPLLPIFQRPIALPSVPIKPVVPIPVLPTRYSYKQIHGDGRVTTYTSNDNRNVMVTESDRPNPLPPFVTYRIQEVMKLGAHGIQHMPAIPAFPGHVQRPMVQYFSSPKVNVYSPTVPTNYFYKQIHKDGTATSYSSDLKGDNGVVTQTGKVHTIPEFFTDRIEKVAATSVIGTQPNIDALSGPHVGQVYLHKQPIVANPKIDIRGGVQVKVDEKGHQKMNAASKGTYSYQTIRKDGTVTSHLNAATASVFKNNNPAENNNIKPISPANIENRLESIAQTSGGSFSYKILHNDGTVTNYGVFGVHKGLSGENEIIPLEKKTPIFQTTTPQLNKKEGLFTHKIIHNDGSVSSYSSGGVVVEKGPGIPESGTAQISDINSNRATAHVIGQSIVKSPQHGNPSVGSFSYKAVHNDGSMTIYSQNGVSDISGPQKESSSGKGKKDDIQTSNQYIHVNNGEVGLNKKVNAQANASPVSSSFSYKTVHNDRSMTTYSQSGLKEEQKGLNAKDVNQQSLGITDQVQGSVSTNLNINFKDTKLRTNPIVDQKSNYEYTTTDVIPAAPKLPEMSSNDLTDDLPKILVANSKKLLLTKPIVSTYSYKQINHNQPDQFTVAVNIGDAASKEDLKVSGQVAANSQTDKDATADPVLNDYVYIPPTTINEPPPVGSLVPVQETHIGTLNPPSAVVMAPVEDVKCVEKLSEHPIVVLDEPMSYSYEHRKVDGSAIIMKSDQHAVSVTISPKKDSVKRGDIP